jgi:hypothetical protein
MQQLLQVQHSSTGQKAVLYLLLLLLTLPCQLENQQHHLHTCRLQALQLAAAEPTVPLAILQQQLLGKRLGLQRLCSLLSA